LPDVHRLRDAALEAKLADAGLTAYHAAAKAARRLTPRDRCVVIGAGGLGHIGIQVLKALDAVPAGFTLTKAALPQERGGVQVYTRTA